MAGLLKKGIGTLRDNVSTLYNSRVLSPARRKAIMTIAKKNNISRDDAKFRQAISIARKYNK